MNRESSFIEAQWWLDGPDAPPVFGKLHTQADNLRVEFVLPHRESPFAVFKRLAVDKAYEQLDMLQGQDRYGKPITLFGCHCTHRRWSSALANYEITVLAGIHGAKVESWMAPRVKSVSLKIDYLHRWLDRRFFNQRDGGSVWMATEHFIATYQINDEVTLRFFQSTGASESADEAVLRPNAWVTFDFARLCSLHDVTGKWVPWIVRLLGLLVGEDVRVEAIECYVPQDPTNPGSEADMGLLLGFGPKERPTMKSWHMLTRYDAVQPRMAEIVQAWHRLNRTMEPVLGLFAAVALHHSLYDKAQFLFLVQALELYHTCSGRFDSTELPKAERDARLTRAMAALPEDLREWAKGKLAQNHKSLRVKLLDVFQTYAAEAGQMFGDLAEAARRIAYTRNRLTHYHDDVREDLTFPETEISRVAWSLEILLWIILLRELGIDGDPVQRLVRRTTEAKFITLRG